jgi:hypothetical protein
MVEAGEVRGSPTEFLTVGAEGQAYFISEGPVKSWDTILIFN